VIIGIEFRSLSGDIKAAFIQVDVTDHSNLHLGKATHEFNRQFTDQSPRDLLNLDSPNISVEGDPHNQVKEGP